MMELILGAFANEWVSIVTTAKMRTNNGEEEMEANITLEGFMIDCDEDFIYLSRTGADLDQAVAREQVVFIDKAVEESMGVLAEMPKIERGEMN